MMLSNPRSWFVSAELLCVVTPMLIDFTAFTDFFCQILCKLGGRGRPSWRVPPLQRRCCSSSVKTNQWLLLWVANECGRALITWASMNNTCAVGGACAARHCLTLDGDDMRGMRRRSVFHQESLLLQRLIGMNKKAFVSPFFRLH